MPGSLIEWACAHCRREQDTSRDRVGRAPGRRRAEHRTGADRLQRPLLSPSLPLRRRLNFDPIGASGHWFLVRFQLHQCTEVAILAREDNR